MVGVWFQGWVHIQTQPVPVMITYTDSIGGKGKSLHEHLKLL